MRPLVSIGLPVYNGEEYIERAIESLLNQTYTNIEVIISDNCSTDGTYKICLECLKKDNRIRLYRNSENVGACNNFMHVFELSSGEYFMWAAYDDLWDRNYLKTLVGLLERDMEASIAFCNIVGIDSENNVIWKCPWTFSLPSRIRLFRLIKYICQNDFHRKAVLIYGLMRTEAIKMAGGFQTWSIHNSGTALHVVFALLMYGNISLSRKVSFYKRKTGRKYYKPASYSKRKLFNYKIINKIGSLFFVFKCSKEHNFVKYLDGYNNVIKTSSNILLTEKIILVLFIFVWKIFLICYLAFRQCFKIDQR